VVHGAIIAESRAVCVRGGLGRMLYCEDERSDS
jgi:hypothetical protein